jgi:cadmium resistance protein CadD (predicted permease)
MFADATGKVLHMAQRKERRLAGNGARFVAIGTPLVIIGIVLALLLDGTARGIGAAIGLLGAIPVVVGITLLLSAGVEERSRREEPFA